MASISPKFIRFMRGLIILVSLFFIEHILCAFSNAYTTNMYVRLATSRESGAQYAVPLYDSFFDGERNCPSSWQLAYDLALWILGFWVIYLLFVSVITDGRSRALEHLFIVMLMHTFFMCLCQISTTLPASGGLEECLAANPHGVGSNWPWYGVSFLTQSFAEARACADMLYSGHVSNLVLLSFGGAKYTSLQVLHWTMSGAFCVIGCVGIVLCQDHYTVDCVLAVIISGLLMTNTHLEGLAKRWAAYNYELEKRILSPKVKKVI